MAKHGEYFPENPQNIDELLDSLAQRAAAAQRMRNVDDPEQRAELDALAQQAFGSPSLMEALNRLDAHLQAARPGEDWDGLGAASPATSRWVSARAPRRWPTSPSSSSSPSSCRRATPGATMDDVDLDMLARQLGEDAAVDARTLAELERALVNQGFLKRGSDGQWRLSPKAMRQLGKAALRDVAQQLSGRQGERDTRRAGAAGELTGATRPWAFGDTEPWDVTRTMTNAVLRQAGRESTEGAASDQRRRCRDSETETRTQAASRCWSTRRSRW